MKQAAPRALILANVATITAEQSLAIERFLNDGGGVLVAPGDRTDAIDWNRTVLRNGRGWLPARFAEIAGSEAALDTAPKPKTAGFEHPAVRTFRDELPGGLHAAYFPRYWKLEPEPSAILGRLTNDEPFLVEKAVARGRAILAAVPFDNTWRTNLTRLPDFVRLAHELVYYLSGSIGASNLAPGEPIVYRPPNDEPPGSVTVSRPDGISVAIPMKAWSAIFEGTRDPGAYILTTASGRTQYFAVQADPREADLTPSDGADREKLNHFLGVVESVSRPGELRSRRGRGPVSREFGGLLLVVVLALLAGELWYTRRLVARST